MTSCPEAMGWEFGDFEKDVSWDPTLVRASRAGGYGMRSAFVGSDSTVSIIKMVSLSLSSCRKTKVKKLINVSYQNNGESSVSYFPAPVYFTTSPNECPVYDIESSDRKAPILQLWWMWSTPFLPLLPGQFYPVMIALDRFRYIYKIELINM